jgi:hypothetical protein
LGQRHLAWPEPPPRATSCAGSRSRTSSGSRHTCTHEVGAAMCTCDVTSTEQRRCVTASANPPQITSDDRTLAQRGGADNKTKPRS